MTHPGKNDILRLRNEGKTYNEISNILGCSKATIHYHCSKLEYDKDIKAKNIKKLRFPTPSFDNEEIIKYLVENGTSKKHIADALRIDYKELLLYCKRYNIKSVKKIGYDRIKHHRRNKKIMATFYMGGECSICGYDKHYAALDFHHKDPDKKDFSISQNSNMSWERVKRELEKCILICSNCHREIHSQWD